MKEEKKQAIYKAYKYSEKLTKHIEKIKNNSDRERELEFAKSLLNIYTKFEDYENESLCSEGNVFSEVIAILKSNKRCILYNRIANKLTEFSGDKISYIDPPKKSIRDKISILAEPNNNEDGTKERQQVKNQDYKLLKEICKELEV